MNYKTAGESHGKGILALIEGFPADFEIDCSKIDAELRRRQGGYGRGGRQAIEGDSVELLSGVWRGRTTGAPITLWIKNRDYRIDDAPPIETPRPGHVDLAGSIKFGMPVRPIMERASARETAGRVAAGALAKQYLETRGIRVIGFVCSIGSVACDPGELPYEEMLDRRDRSELYTICPEADSKFKALIDDAAERGDTLGGVIEARAFGVPIGLGSHAQWDERLDGRIAQAVMSIQAIKGVEIGLGFKAAQLPGSEVHDPIGFDAGSERSSSRGFTRPTNNAGGIEGGISNGQPIVVRAAMKPIPTLRKPLASIDLSTKRPVPSVYERSDVCAVPAASVVLESILSFEIMGSMIENGERRTENGEQREKDG